MSTHSSDETDNTSEAPDPDDVPTFEGQVVFKGDFDSSDNDTVHKDKDE